MIQTDRLILRPMLAEDAEPLLRVFGDPLVMAAFGVSPFDGERMDAWVRRNLEHQEEHGFGLFSVILKSSGELIGDCGLELMDAADLDDDPAGVETGPVAELGYDLRRDSWNRGYATEAAMAVRDHAFGPLALPRLVSLIRQGNGASRRVAEKVGMRHVRDLDRGGVPYWLFALDAPDHRAR